LPYRHGAVSNFSSNLDASVSSGSSGGAHRQPVMSYHRGDMSEREKMITGRPYRHYTDFQLIIDRDTCMRAVHEYNESALGQLGPETQTAREMAFRRIIEPGLRGGDPEQWRGVPPGSVGMRTIVTTPFKCEYGYNLNFGDDVVVGANCQFWDSARIEIGSHTFIGPNVKLYCMAPSVAMANRGGSLGDYRAGMIRIEDHCFIGADVTILPYRTIGRGSVIAAGSIVTRVSFTSHALDIFP
jgi:acetyltransferase-like isoleucine patch superfamily enzyme